ncbi:MAG: DUF4262 domain-containing protein [Herbiconiux sp.]|uniref:DUF4262 domain-containing protein n=1 Tax=Herbiconiux sp. TaxID=1871186 RepID=UPI0011FD62FF|nr:DUF4262 domain-containing protein [Herbiconiux sp.]TAJ49911.1 MAG: DUF4262 domain-containing protein [Herbiconiux sp.]
MSEMDPLGATRDLVERYGWAVRHVLAGRMPSEPPFSYTIGLSSRPHPELVIVGLPPDVAKAFLDIAVAMIDDGRTFVPGEMAHGLAGDDRPLAVIRVDDAHELSAVEEIYGSVNALQLVWPDSSGRFPWVVGYANAAEVQPLLGSIPGAWRSS